MAPRVLVIEIREERGLASVGAARYFKLVTVFSRRVSGQKAGQGTTPKKQTYLAFNHRSLKVDFPLSDNTSLFKMLDTSLGAGSTGISRATQA